MHTDKYIAALVLLFTFYTQLSYITIAELIHQKKTKEKSKWFIASFMTAKLCKYVLL